MVAHQCEGGQQVAGEVVLVTVVGTVCEQQEADTVCGPGSWLLAVMSRGGLTTVVATVMVGVSAGCYMTVAHCRPIQCSPELQEGGAMGR